MRLAVFTKNRSNPAYFAARLGADRAAAVFGDRVDHYVPETPDNAAQQSALIDRALATAPDAFVLSPVHPSAVDAAVRRIRAAGLPVFAFVNPTQAMEMTTYVGADDTALARRVAGHLFRRLGGRGRVLVLGGHRTSVTSQDRLRGFAEAATTKPGVELLEILYGDYQRETAREVVAGWLAKHAGDAPDGVLVANDIMALGVLEALDAAGARALVVGVNAIPEAIAAIAAGRLLATADFNAQQMAYTATECACRHLRGEAVPRCIDLPVELVDATNRHFWDQPYEARAVKPLAELNA